MKPLFALLVLLVGVGWVSAQPTSTRRDATVWYFGANAGVSFETGVPVPLTNGQIDTHEGSSVISSQTTGRLLFYSDGLTVWDSTHAQMPNGTGLMGHWTSAQSVLIVPMPDDTNRFYIFTTGAGLYHTGPDHGPNNNGFRYSIVDMRLNGGRGDVTLKNVVLLGQSSEMVTATKHCNGVDYWVIAHDWNENGGSGFRSYHLTPQGITDTTISQVGMDFTSGFRTQNMAKLSSTGNLMAVTSIATQKAVELYDFDNASGAISNVRLIDTGINFYSPVFSPDNKKLYTSSLSDQSDPNFLYQYDLSSPDPQVIRSSRYLVHQQSGSWQGGQMQLAPDGKVYVSYFSDIALGVINNPNLSGAACDYRHSSVNLGGRRTEYGLPNFIDSDVYGASLSQSIDARVTLRSLEDTVDAGQTVSVQLIACNNSATFLTDVALDVNLPAGLSYVNGLNGYPRHRIGALPPGSCDTVTMQVRVDGGLSEYHRLTTCARLSAAGEGACISISASDSSCLVMTTGCTQKLLGVRMEPHIIYETGRRFSAPVTLTSTPPESVKLTHLILTVEFDSVVALGDLSSDLTELTRGTLLDGWMVVNVLKEPGRVSVELQAPPNVSLRNAGVVLRVPLRLFMSATGEISSYLRPAIAALGVPCVEFVPTDGNARLDSICGLNFRFIQIELNGKYALDVVHPHPVGDHLGVAFELGLDGETVLEVVDLMGRTVAVPLHETLQPGHYDVIWDARSLPSGRYLLHLRSGDWHTSRSIVIKR